jgi:2-polyprenyl-6-methoxyphenol hydroxylase-like FAD-dependent oxidoreductase
MDYDVIIVGARVAGSSLAILLGRQGRRVLLVDRDRFPSTTLSTHLLRPAAVHSLARLGALADVEATGVRRLTRQRTYVGSALFEGDMEAPGAYALCPGRDSLDWILIGHARAHASVEFREETAVEGLTWEDGRVTGVRLRDRDGRRSTAHGHVVVGADGKFSKVARWVQAPSYQAVPALRPVYYAYYRGLAPLPEPAVEVFYQDGHIGFVLPMEPERDCLALEVQLEEFEWFHADPAGRLEAALHRLSGMARRIERARREGPVYGTRGVENFLRVPFGPGWALTGDAAYCKDPSTGTGIQDAFTQAFPLAEALGAALDGAAWEQAMAAYHRQRDEAVLPTYRSTIAYTRTAEAPAEAQAWLQSVLASPGLVRLLATNFPAVARSAEVFPAALQPAIARGAHLFGAAAAASAEVEQAAA